MLEKVKKGPLRGYYLPTLGIDAIPTLGNMGAKDDNFRQ